LLLDCAGDAGLNVVDPGDDLGDLRNRRDTSALRESSKGRRWISENEIEVSDAWVP
jgi:hypothetical protein